MKKYFEIIGKRLTLDIDLTKEGKKLTTEQISENMGLDLREINKSEFKKLSKEFLESERK